MRNLTFYEEPIKNHSPSDEELELFHGFEDEFDKEPYGTETGHRHDCRCGMCLEADENEYFLGDLWDWGKGLFDDPSKITYSVKPGEEFGGKHKSKPAPGLPTWVRKTGEKYSALPHVRSLAKKEKLSGVFVKAIEQMARMESGGRFALPAKYFNANPPSERPPGKKLVAAWGVFQFNRNAWTCLFSEGERKSKKSYIPKAPKGTPGCKGCRGRGGCVFPWDCTAKEEIERPIKRYSQLFTDVLGAGGSDEDAAAGLRIWHIAPSLYEKWLENAEQNSFKQAWNSKLSQGFRNRIKSFLKKADITANYEYEFNLKSNHNSFEITDFFDQEYEFEQEINTKRAVQQNRKYAESLKWDDHSSAIAIDLLNIPYLPVTESTFAEEVAKWQKNNCFRSNDGVIGPSTWREMKMFLGLLKPLIPKKPVQKVNYLLPKSGQGFCSGKPQRQRYGLQETILALTKIGKLWSLKHPNGPRIRIGDISKRGGGQLGTHGSHRMGIDIDIGLIRSDGKEKRVNFKTQKRYYSRPLTQELFDIILNNGVLKVHVIFFDDRKIIAPRGIIISDGIHKNHMHVRFCMPSKNNLKEMKKKAFPAGTPGTYGSCI